MDTRRHPREALGRAGEEIAARHLEARGFEVLARCARTAAGELDVVAFGGDAIVFVEVKTRGAGALEDRVGGPLVSIGPRKRARVRRAGAAWLAEHRNRPRASAIRFDAIGVTIDPAGHVRALEHVRDAF